MGDVMMKQLKAGGFILILLLAMLVAGCGTKDGDAQPHSLNAAKEVRIGYFPNMTHIATIIALENHYFEEALGSDIQIVTKTFADGAAFMEGMSTDTIDLGTVGPTPVINNYVKNPAHQIIAGAINAGAVLVVREDSDIQSVADLDGKKIAIPAIGGTQDIMLMKELKEAGLSVKLNGGTVETIKQAPADTAALFLRKDVDAAATQEPWGVNLQHKANAKVLLDSDEFAWGNESTNTVLVAAKSFTEANPDVTTSIVQAHVKAIAFINEHPEEAVQLFIDHIKEITNQQLETEEVTLALARSIPTYDINEQVLKEMTTISKEAGYIASDNIEGLINLSYLEAALQQ